MVKMRVVIEKEIGLIGANPKVKQAFLQLDQVNFKEQIVSSFLSADIPLHKLNHPSVC